MHSQLNVWGNPTLSGHFLLLTVSKSFGGSVKVAQISRAQRSLLFDRFFSAAMREERGQRDLFPPLHPNTVDPLHDEGVIAVRWEVHLQLEFYQRDVDVGVRVTWEASCDVVSKSFQGVITVAKEDESTAL